MAGDKFLYNNAGAITEKVSNQASAGAGDAGKIVALDSTGRIDSTMMPVGIGADTVSLVASEALSAGNFVNIYNNAGTPNCRKADASTTGKTAHGFVLAAVSNGASGTVYLAGQNTQLSALTAGDVYLSDTTPGGVVATAPSGSGKTVQKVGVAISATAVDFTRGTPIVLA